MPLPRTTFNPVAVAASLIFSIAAAAPLDAATLDETAIHQAYRTLDAWLHADGPSPDAQPIPVEGAAAVRVTLRIDGRTIAAATAHVQRPLDPALIAADDRPAEPTDITPLLRAALIDAIRQADANDPVAVTQRPDEIVADLQVAGAPRPIILSGFGELPGQLTIDVHGLAISHGEGWAFAFPGDSIAANLRLDNQINRLLAELDLPPDRLPLVGRPEGVPLFRFDCAHVLRPAPGLPPMTLYRGNLPAPAGPLPVARLNELFAVVTEQLLTRQTPDGLFVGTYHPTSGEYDPPLALLSEFAQAAWILGRISRIESVPEPLRQRSAIAAKRSAEAFIRILDDDRINRPARSLLGGHLGPNALALMVILDTPNLPDTRPLRHRLVGTLRSMQRPIGVFLARDDNHNRFATISQQALAAAAFARLYELTREDQDLRAAHLALKYLWSVVDDSNIHDAMPWALYAEADLARLAVPAESYPGLVSRFQPIWDSQQKAAAAPGSRLPVSPDTIGGFRIPGRLIDEPEWKSAESLTAAAIILSRGDLVPPDRQPGWILDSSLAARFLDHLTMSAASCWYVKRPVQAIGGVRISLWDNRQSLPATASTSLALAEFLHALAAFQDAENP